MANKSQTKQTVKQEDERRKVLIRGRLYDVTDFDRNHPGGRIFKYYLDSDATQAWNAFHLRSEKAEKWLKSMPSEPYTSNMTSHGQPSPKDAALLADYDKLCEELTAIGLFDPSLAHSIYRISEILIMHIVALYMVLWLGGLWVIPGFIIAGLGQGRCGWLMHEGGHSSVTGFPKIDRPLQEFLYGFGCGMSACFWRNQHNKHHATPQRMGTDPDLDTLPLVAFSKYVLKDKTPKGVRNWVSFQHYCFPIISCFLVAVFWQTYLHPRHSLRTKTYQEIFYMALRYFTWGYVFVPHFGVFGAIVLYLAYVWVGANYIFINFAVSHTHLPITHKEDEMLNWVHFSAKHTMNCSNHWFVNWWMGYLNFQIEHHLFPSVPQYRFAAISPYTKKFFEKHGLHYMQTGYFWALSTTFNNLKAVGEAAIH